MNKRFINGVLGFMLVLIFWHLGSIALNKAFLPTPAASFSAFFSQLFYGEMGRHFLISSYRIIASLVLALSVAIPLGLAMGRIPGFGKLLNPVVYMIYPLPKIVFLPVIVVLMGLGNGPKIFLISLVVFFQIVVVTRDGAAAVPADSILSMKSLNASRLQTFWHLILPACLPQILTSLRITLGTAIAVLFSAETFVSFDGLGYFIMDGMEIRDYPAMYAGIIAMAVLGLILYWIVDFMEYRFCAYMRED